MYRKTFFFFEIHTHRLLFIVSFNIFFFFFKSGRDTSHCRYAAVLDDGNMRNWEVWISWVYTLLFRVINGTNKSRKCGLKTCPKCKVPCRNLKKSPASGRTPIIGPIQIAANNIAKQKSCWESEKRFKWSARTTGWPSGKSAFL